MTKVRFFQGKCGECRTEFGLPSLGDFTYGSVIFSGNKGTVFGHLHLINSSIVGEIREILQSLKKEQLYERSLQNLLVKVADPIDGQRLQTKQTCPSCGSLNLSLDEARMLEDKEIPLITFHRFLSQDEAARINEIAMAVLP